MIGLIIIPSLRHFTEREIEMGRDIPANIIDNIIPTARILDELREVYGSPIFINSSYRSPEYNKAVKGKPKSLHLEFNAIDFSVENRKDLGKLFDILERWDAEKNKFDFLPKPNGNMGIGLYSGRFIHLDTRATLDRIAPARWRG
jgi:hypothetical protein